MARPTISSMPKSNVVEMARSIIARPNGGRKRRDPGIAPDPSGTTAVAPIPHGDPATIPPGTRRIGVIFVHGIGTQPPRETFLNWSNPIVEMLSEWRREHDEANPCKPMIGENPVQTGAIECDDGCDERAWARIAIPKIGEHPAETWLLTEAYWAGVVRAPSFGQALRYLQGHIAAIISGIANGYGIREDRRTDRLRKIIDSQPEPRDARVKAEIEELQRSDSLQWRWIDWLDRIWKFQVIRRLLALIATVVSLVALAIYAPLRAIPIKAIRERAELAALDAQLVDAFGDLPVLLDDAVQSAIIRQRLASTIEWVLDRGCDEVVLIAHSGGAIVSYATLLDPAYHRLPVAKLMTLGQGLALGWRLERVTAPFVAGNPIRGDLGAARHDLRWVDFWASYDPAPAGELQPVDGCPLIAVQDVDTKLPPSPIQVESRPITNYMHMGQDHGGYWENDEGFLVPLIRHIDDAKGDGGDSRFYTDKLGRAVRIERRRRRVGLLLGWRWASLAAGIATLVLAILPGITPDVRIDDTGNALAKVLSYIPGHELVAGPIHGLGATIAALFLAIGVDIGPAAAWLGPILLGMLLPVIGGFLIYSRGVGSWKATDAAERKLIRREVFGPAGSAWAKSEAILLIGGLIGLVFAGAGVTPGVLVGELVGTAILSLVIRAAFRQG